MGGKLADAPRMRTPGPGAYSPNAYTLPLAPKYSLSPRREQLNVMKFVPGPGTYDPLHPAHKGRNIAMGIKLEYNSPYGVGKGTPGPADYNVDAATTFSTTMQTKGGMKAAPRFSFGLKPSYGGVYGSLSKTPGPGTYEPPTTRGLAYSMTPRNPVKQPFVTPGPGAYEMRYGSTRRGTFTSVRHSLHARVRPVKFSNSSTPGPGQYEAPQQFWGPPLP